MNTMTAIRPMMPAHLPAAIESAPRLGADGPLLDHGQRGRQSAGAQQDRELVGTFDREIAGDDAIAAEDRLVDPGRADHLVVKHDRKQLIHVIIRVTLPNLRAPTLSKVKLTTGWFC